MKCLKDQIIQTRPKLCDEILTVLEHRAELEIKDESKIDQAVITLRLALDLRKPMLENILEVLQKGSKKKRNIKSVLSKKKTDSRKRLLSQIPDHVICTTARLLLLLSRCFQKQGKTRCAYRAKKDAQALFQTKRVTL
jgi:hypothetical protein